MRKKEELCVCSENSVNSVAKKIKLATERTENTEGEKRQ